MSDEDVLSFAAKGGTGMARPKGADIEVEFGVTTILPFTGWTEDGGGEVAFTGSVEIDKLTEMRRKDGQARAIMRLFTLPILQALGDAHWVHPDGTDGEEEAEEVEFANAMFFTPEHYGGMNRPLGYVVRHILRALVEGFSVFEEVRHVPKEGPLKGKITLKKLAHRDPRTVRFIVDEKGDFSGIRQIASASFNHKPIDVRIPKDKCWVYTVNEEENPFYGVSYFEAAYHHHEIKRRLYYITHLAAQFAAVPGRVGTVPQSANPRDVASFKNALSNFAFNTAMVKKDGYTVDPFNMNSQFDFLKIIDHHNRQMSKSVLANFLDEENRQVLIENGSGSDASVDLFMMALEGIMNEIEERLTHVLMPKYIDWNFGSELYPHFKFGQLTDSTRDIVKDMLTAVSTAQSSMWTDEFIRELEKRMDERLGLEVDYDAVEKREEEEKAKIEEQEKLQQEFLKSQQGGGGFGGPPQEEEEEAGPPPPGGFRGPPKGPPGTAALSVSDISAEILRMAAESGLAVASEKMP